MTDNEFPQAIVHVDGDSFFVSCEVACRPDLKGKPVVTGQERHIATAMSYEAKKLGVHRGMSIHEIRKNYPQVVILPSQYGLYKMFSQRMYEILKRYASIVEWYSIDECFADITGTQKVFKKPYEKIVQEIKETLSNELGITFSLGLSVNKVVAKVASKWRKPNGFTIIPKSNIKEFLNDIPLGKIWGIGPSTSHSLARFGVVTALDFLSKRREWIEEHCPKPVMEIWFELNGLSIFKVHADGRELPKSISSTETFWPATSSKEFIYSELSRHVEDVAFRARDKSLVASGFSFFIKTKEFRYRRQECKLAIPGNLPHEMMRLIKPTFNNIYDPRIIYRSAGVTLFGLSPEHIRPDDLFGESNKLKELRKVYDAADFMAMKYGRSTVFLGSSLKKGETPIKSRRNKKKFFIPFLGKVK